MLITVKCCKLYFTLLVGALEHFYLFEADCEAFSQVDVYKCNSKP